MISQLSRESLRYPKYIRKQSSQEQPNILSIRARNQPLKRVNQQPKFKFSSAHLIPSAYTYCGTRKKKNDSNASVPAARALYIYIQTKIRKLRESLMNRHLARECPAEKIEEAGCDEAVFHSRITHFPGARVYGYMICIWWLEDCAALILPDDGWGDLRRVNICVVYSVNWFFRYSEGSDIFDEGSRYRNGIFKIEYAEMTQQVFYILRWVNWIFSVKNYYIDPISN